MTTHAKIEERHRVAASGLLQTIALTVHATEHIDSLQMELAAEFIANLEADAVERCCAAVCNSCKSGNGHAFAIERYPCYPIRQAMAEGGSG